MSGTRPVSLMSIKGFLISKVLQIGVILAEGGDPERLPTMATKNAVLLKSRSGYPPSASMTALWMALLKHLANQQMIYSKDGAIAFLLKPLFYRGYIQYLAIVDFYRITHLAPVKTGFHGKAV